MGAAELDYRSIKDIVRGTWSQVWGDYGIQQLFKCTKQNL